MAQQQGEVPALCRGGGGGSICVVHLMQPYTFKSQRMQSPAAEKLDSPDLVYDFPAELYLVMILKSMSRWFVK